MKSRCPTFQFLVTLLVAAIAGSASFAPTPAEAQFFFNIFRPRHYIPPPPEPPQSYAPERRDAPWDDLFGIFRGERGASDEPKREGDAFAHYCVRTCDGKFFPVNSGTGKTVSPEKLCSAMCPAAQTKVFSGAGIDHASAPDGQRYTSLQNAFLYRTKIVDNCSCNGRDPFGVATIDPENDPTIQSGDIITRKTGFALYRGGQNFVPLEKSGMSAAYIKQLQGIKILPANPHATFTRTMPVKEPAPELVTQKTPDETPGLNANAPAAEPPARTN